MLYILMYIVGVRSVYPQIIFPSLSNDNQESKSHMKISKLLLSPPAVLLSTCSSVLFLMKLTFPLSFPLSQKCTQSDLSFSQQFL